MPDNASTPIQPSPIARATRSSQVSPAATVTKAPPHVSPSTSTPAVAISTTLPSKPSSATTRLLPPASRRGAVPAPSAALTASTSSASLVARVQSLAGPPSRRVVWSASSANVDHRPRRTEDLGAGARHLEDDTRLSVRDVGDAAGDGDHCAGVVVGHDDGVRELRSELADAAGAAGPVVERPGGQRHREHPVRDDAGQADRPGHAVRPVDRVEVAAGTGVADQVGPGHGVLPRRELPAGFPQRRTGRAPGRRFGLTRWGGTCWGVVG